MRIWEVCVLSKSYREAQFSPVSHLLDMKGRGFLELRLFFQYHRAPINFNTVLLYTFINMTI